MNNNILLKNLLNDIEYLENQNNNYSKKTNDIILELIKNFKDCDSDIKIELYSPTKKCNIEFINQMGKYKKVTKKNIKNLNNRCSICLDNYKLNESFRILPKCKHEFHKKCIDKWFKLNIKKKCPICYFSYDYLLDKCNAKQFIEL